jgi:hypothetical protein
MGWGISLLVEQLRTAQVNLQIAWLHRQRGSKKGKKSKKGKNFFLPFLLFLPLRIIKPRVSARSRAEAAREWRRQWE